MILLMTFLFSFGGLFVPDDLVPSWLAWCTHANLLIYSFQLALHVVFAVGFPNTTFTCAAAQHSRINGTVVAASSDYPAACGPGGVGLISGPDVLAFYNVDRPPWLCVAVLVTVGVVSRVVAYGALRYWMVGRSERVAFSSPKAAGPASVASVAASVRAPAEDLTIGGDKGGVDDAVEVEVVVLAVA